MSKINLKGSRVLLSKPFVKESAIELSASDRASIEEEQMLKEWTKLEVFAIGDKVSDADIVPGKRVYVSTGALTQAEKIEIEGEVKLLINELSILIVW